MTTPPDKSRIISVPETNRSTAAPFQSRSITAQATSRNLGRHPGPQPPPLFNGIELENRQGVWTWLDGTVIEWNGSAVANDNIALENGSGSWTWDNGTFVNWG